MDNVARATSRVFVTNFQERDFGPADKFGETIFITRGYVPLRDIGALRNKLVAHIAYSKADDFIILTGPAVLIAMFTLLWTQKHGFMNVLSWNTRDKEYIHYVVGADSVQEWQQ
jgi:hypothetical protein